ncbi:hypothetical protein [Oligella sp. HMSC09E12]|uniref:hypothetical protein n=1 Tax=Oligella sp. HMSC09E12 TaxID=1581147 RepID=UPI0008A3E374|nr:hypothetical protein [Oligella sp. HMSC09E12]OFV47351.1 hypothetical protein HMPREF3179_08645 [Oligella sp. HMSC09E12]
MFDNLDLTSLDIELTDEQTNALKEALSAKAKEEFDKQVAGLKTKNSELLGTIKATKGELESLKNQFDGLDIEAVKLLLSKASEDEETRLIAEGKIDELVNRRTERLRSDYDKQLQAAISRAEQAEQFANQFKDKVLSDAIREAAVKAGALPEAADDIILRSRSVFKLNEHGEAVAFAKDGEVIYSKDGKTPLSPLEWVESLREIAPHLWPRAQGTGPTGDNGGRSKKQFSELTEAERIKLYRENPDNYRQLRDAAN